MKKLLFPFLLLFSFVASAQTPWAGSTQVNARYKWLAGKFEQLKLPMYADTTQYPGWLPLVGGDIMLDTAGADLGTIWARYNRYWHPIIGSGGSSDTSGYRYFSAIYPLTLVGSGDTAYVSIDTAGLGGGGSSTVSLPYKNVDSLRLHTAASFQGASTLGYYAPGDGGAVSYYWDPTSTATDDSLTVIKVTGTTTGRWRQLLYNGIINPKTGGAKGDGTTDDYWRIQSALTVAGTLNCEVRFPGGVFTHSRTLTPPQNIVIRGAGNRKTTLQITTDTVGMVISSSNMVSDMRFFGGNSFTASTGLKVQGGNKSFIQRVRAENFHHTGFKFIDAQNGLYEDLMAQYNGDANYYLDGTENCSFENANANSDNTQNGTPNTMSIYMTDCNNTHWNGGLMERGDNDRQVVLDGACVNATFENMQINSGAQECILVKGGSSAIFEKIQFSRATNAWNVNTTGTNSSSTIINCTTLGSNGLGNDKLYTGRNLFNGSIEVPIFATNFAGQTSGSTIGTGTTLTLNSTGQNMTVNTINPNAGVEMGLSTGSGSFRPGQNVLLEFTIKGIDDSSYLDVYNSRAGGRDFLIRVTEGPQRVYYSAKGYESLRFGFLNPKSGSHQFTMSGARISLLGSDSMPLSRVTHPVQLGIYTPAVDTTAKGMQLYNAAQTKSLITATREVPATDTLGIASHRYPAGVYNINKQFIGVAYNQAEAVSIWNANTANTAIDHIGAGSSAYSFLADTIGMVYLQPQTTIGTIWNDEFTRGYFGPNYDTTDIGTMTRGFSNGHLYLKRTIFAGDFAGIVKYIGHGKSTYRNIEVEIGYKMNTALNATTYGPVLGLFSTRNPDQNCSSLAFTNFSTDGTGLSLGGASASGTIATKTTTTNFVTKDTVTNQVLNLSVNIDTLRGVMVNNKDEFVSSSYFYDFNNTAQTATKPNIYYPAFGVNGTADVRFDYFRVYTKEKRYVKMAFLGNSITTGYYGGRAGNSFPDQLKGYTNYDIQTLAGGYNRSQDVIDNLNEVIDMHPQYAFLEIGSNDRGSGVSQATLLANIDTINNRLARNGITLYHLAAPDAGNPFTGGTTNALLKAAYGSRFIDIWTGQYTTGTSVDAVHPNERGYKQIADSIAAKLPFLFPNPPKGIGRDYSSAVQRDIVFPDPVIPSLQDVTTVGNTTTNRVDINLSAPYNSGLKVGSMELESLAGDHGMLFNNMYYDQAIGFKWRSTGAATMIQNYQGSMRFVAFNSGTGGTQANIGTYKQVLYLDNTGAIKLGGDNGTTPASLDIDANALSLFNGRVIAGLSLRVVDSLKLTRNALLTDLTGYDILARNRTDQSVYSLPFDSITARISRAGGGGTSYTGAPAHDSASIAEINAGTVNNKFAAPLQLEGSKYLDQDGSKLFILTAGSANTYTATYSPAFAAYTDGMVIRVKIHAANTGATTINVNGLGAKTVVKGVSTALASGDLPINVYQEMIYNGTNFQLLGWYSDVLKGNLATTNTWALGQTFTSAMTVNNNITSNGTVQGGVISSNGGRANFGSIAAAFSAKTAAYTMLAANDNSITADATTAAFNVTLPTAVGNTGLRLTVKRINSGANAVTLVTTSSQTIDGASTYVLNKQNDIITVLSDGANWRIVEMYTGSMWNYVTGGINAAGNVGINNTSPSTALDVTGTIQASSLSGTNIGHLLVGANGNISRYDGTYISQSVSAAGTLTMTNHDYYVFTGTTATWTLPAAGTSGNRAFTIKNRGSGNITLNSNSGSEIYTTSAVASVTILPGGTLYIICDGSFWGTN